MNTAGTKGRLKLPGQDVDIPFTLIHEFKDNYQGYIANTLVTNTFSKEAGWIFEADKPQLPTEAGSVIDVRSTPETGYVTKVRWMLLIGNDWVSYAGNHMRSEELQRFIRSNYLTFEVV